MTTQSGFGGLLVGVRLVQISEFLWLQHDLMLSWTFMLCCTHPYVLFCSSRTLRGRRHGHGALVGAS